MPPPLYINTTSRKTLEVARYTLYGEYNDGEKFHLSILYSYIDEIFEGYLQRVFYAVQDGGRSLIFWKNQVYVGGRIGIPLYSLLLFVLCLLAVERPRFIPAVFFFMGTLFFYVQMQQRVKLPSPWRRCFSFSYYLRILITGKSKPAYQSIHVQEGQEEMDKMDQLLERRIAADKEFFEQKQEVEKEIEDLQNQRIETRTDLVPFELMIVLGRLQGIVGGTFF